MIWRHLRGRMALPELPRALFVRLGQRLQDRAASCVDGPRMLLPRPAGPDYSDPQIVFHERAGNSFARLCAEFFQERALLLALENFSFQARRSRRIAPPILRNLGAPLLPRRFFAMLQRVE